MTATTTPAPWGLPLLAAGVTLLGPAVGGVLFLTQLERPAEVDEWNSGPLSQLAAAWNEGGWPMYAVLGGAVFLAFLSALFVLFASRGSAAIAGVLPLFTALPAAMGAAGTHLGLHGSVLAVEHASPADRVTILCASAKEALWCTTLGTCLSAGACLALAVALLLGSRAQPVPQKSAHRQALLLGGMLLAGFATLSFIGAITSRQVGEAFGLAAYREDLSAVALQVTSFLRWQSLAVGAVMTVLVLVATLTVVFKAPASARVAFAITSLMGALLLGVSVRSKLGAEFEEAVSTPARSAELLKFDSPTTHVGAGPAITANVDEAEALRSSLRTWRELHEAAMDNSFSSGLSLRPDASAAALQVALKVALEEKYEEITLLTEPTAPAPATLPPPFDLPGLQPRGLSVRLAWRGLVCDEQCPLATLTGEALVAGDEKWPLERGSTEQKSGDPVLYLAADAIEPRRLLEAIATSAKHRRTLTVLFEGEPRNPNEDAPLPPPPPGAPNARVEFLKLRVSGPLQLANVKQVLNAASDALAGCASDETTLPVTVHLEAAVAGDGEVAVSVLDEREELGWCVRERFNVLEFANVDQISLSLVKFDLKFSEAPKKKK